MRNREDWLVEQLNGFLSDKLREKYEMELEAIADALTRRDHKIKIARQAEARRRAEIRARIVANDEDYVWTLGEAEFKDDYELVQEGSDFIVYSKVARDDQTHRRTHLTFEAARADLRYLYWNRLYTAYVRTNDADSVIDLLNTHEVTYLPEKENVWKVQRCLREHIVVTVSL